MKVKRALVVLAPLLAASWNASASDGVLISKVEYGDRWPFTVKSGRLECLPPRQVVFHADNGKTYGINGTASARYGDMRPIWRDNPNPGNNGYGYGPKVNIGPIIDRGLDLC